VLVRSSFGVRGANLPAVLRALVASGGFNPRAIVALVTGVAVALIGLVVPMLHWLYDYAWFVGFFASGSTYALLMQGYSPSGVMQAQQKSFAGKRA